MKRLLVAFGALLLLAVAAAPVPAQASVSVGVSIHVGDPYRGFSLHFRSEPNYVLVPSTQVYCAEDDYGRTLYRYGGEWYLVDDDQWYCADSYRGPYRLVREVYVPVQVCDVYRSRYSSWSGGYASYQAPRYRTYSGSGDWTRERVVYQSEPRYESRDTGRRGGGPPDHAPAHGYRRNHGNGRG